MVEKFKPYDYQPFGYYDPRVSSILIPNAVDIVLFFTAKAIFQQNVSVPSLLSVKYCGNPNCLAPFGHRENNKPNYCAYCKNQIDWG